MPAINFNLASGKYANLSKAIIAYNESSPNDPAIDENDFAKRATLAALGDYLTRYRNSRLAQIADQIASCSDSQWNAVTGALA